MVKRVFLNKKFYIVSIILIFAFFLTGYSYIEQVIKSGYTLEEAGWGAVYFYCITNENILLLIPLLIPVIASADLEIELENRFSLFCCARIGKKAYARKKVIEIILSAGSAMCCSILFFCLIIYVVLRGRINSDASVVQIISIVASSLLRGFLNGAFWGGVGTLAAIMLKNRYLAFSIPFVTYYVLTIFQKRYYETLFFLSPRYWAAPVYYSNLFCISVLFVLAAVVSVSLIFMVYRRLDYARH